MQKLAYAWVRMTLQQVWVGKCMGSFRGELNSSKQLQQVWVGKCMGSFRGELNSSKQLQQVWVGKCMGSFRGELNSSKQLQQVWVGKCMGSFSYITLGECNRCTLIHVYLPYLLVSDLEGDEWSVQ